MRGEAVHVKRYDDVEAWDRMWRCGQLSDMQHAAAERYARMFVAAGLHPRLSADYGERGGGRVNHPEDYVSPLDVYRRTTRECPLQFVARIESMVLGLHPGIAHVETLQAGLDWFASYWQLADLVDDGDDA